MNQTQLTIDNFFQETGYHFRVNRKQSALIKAGTLTREQAFQEFITNGGLESLKARPRGKHIGLNAVLQHEGLTLENFSEVSKNLTGNARRFRMNRSQVERFKAGTLTREQALSESIAEARVIATAQVGV